MQGSRLLALRSLLQHFAEVFVTNTLLQEHYFRLAWTGVCQCLYKGIQPTGVDTHSQRNEGREGERERGRERERERERQGEREREREREKRVSATHQLGDI